jgi:hypothetical protein
MSIGTTVERTAQARSWEAAGHEAPRTERARLLDGMLLDPGECHCPENCRLDHEND